MARGRGYLGFGDYKGLKNTISEKILVQTIGTC